MTAGVNPQLAQRLAETQANIRARSAQISDNVRAQSREIADEAQRLREANEALCEELDKRVEDRIAAKDDPNAQDAWARPVENREMRYGVGELADETEKPSEPVLSPEPPSSMSKPSRRKGRHGRHDESLDDDFSNTNWLD